MSKFIRGRFSLAILIMGCFILLASITRMSLMYDSLHQIDFQIFDIVKIYIIGFIYDTITASYLLVPWVLYLILIPNPIFNLKFHKYLFNFILLIQVNILTFTVFSEWFFWQEFGKRFDFIAVDYLIYTTEVVQNIFESYPMGLLMSSTIFISSLFLFIMHKKTSIFRVAFSSHQNMFQRLIIGICFMIIPSCSYFGFNEKIIKNIFPNQFNLELAKNGIYTFFSAFRNNTLDYDTYFISEDTEKIFSNLKTLSNIDIHNPPKIQSSGPELKYNVMLIMEESLSAKYMDVFGHDQGLTPYLDQLAKQSLFFNNFYATGTRTVRGMEAVTLSIPPTPGRSIVKRPDCHNLYSSGFIFQEKGYENKFIYAGYGYFDNMNDFFSHNGFEIIDRLNMDTNDITFSNVWGVCDEDLFDMVIKEADKSYQKNVPFFNYVMTTSNHRPYTYPDGKIDIPSHTGRAGGVKYADYAVGQFLEKVKSKPWFQNTIFVILADHNGGSSGKTSLPAYRYKIPLFIYAPHIITPQVIEKLSSQIDLMPTLFSILNWSYENHFFGQNILDNNFPERAFIGTYQKLGLIQNGNLIVLDSDKSIKEYQIVHQSLYDVEYQEIKPNEKDSLDVISFYQSASYIFKNDLNRYKPSM